MMTMKNTPRRASRGFRIIFATTVVGCILLGAISAGATPSKATKKHSDRSRRVVLFSLPRVTWSTLQTATTPNIDKLISRGSVAAMSVRTLGVVTTPAEGYATISAGNRAAAVDSSQTSFLSPTETFDGDIAKSIYRDERGISSVKNPAALGVGFELSLRANARGLFESKIGSFADALYHHHKSIAVFGNTDTCTTDQPRCFERAIGYIAADSQGVVRKGDISRDLLNPRTPQETTQLSLNENAVTSKAKAAIEKNAVTVVECSDLERVQLARTRTRTSISNKDFISALENCDALVGKVLTSVSLSHDQVYVLSASAPRSQEQTTLFIAAGKDIPRGYAASATTRRVGVVTLVDVSPTILRFLHVPLPRAMGQTPMDWHSNSHTRATRENFLVKMNNQAIVRDKSIAPVTLFFVFLIITSVLVSMVAYTRARSWRSCARFMALMSACFPTFTFLIKPLTESIATPSHMVVVLAVLSAIAAWILMRAGSKWGYVKVILGIATFNLVVQFIDILSGGNLQFNTVFGYSPIVAGRFAGFGNQSFAIIAISAVIVVAMIKEIAASHPQWNEKKVNASLLTFLIVMLFIEGAPYFGSDVGGVLALTPTIFVIGLMFYNKRIGIKSFLIASVVTVGAVTVFALIDLARPVSQRTHLGRFAESLVKGEAGVVIERKLASNLSILTASIWGVIVIVALLYILFLFLHPERFLRKTNDAHPGFRYLVYPAVVVGVLGMVLNDSGVSIPGMMLANVLPAVTLLALGLATEKESNKTPETKSA